MSFTFEEIAIIGTSLDFTRKWSKKHDKQFYKEVKLLEIKVFEIAKAMKEAEQ